jgi:sugar phosphate permease
MNDSKTTFAITYASYASVHAARKSFSNSKAQLHEFYGFSAAEAGNVDALFMFIYAVGLVLGGRIADKRATSRVFGVGLLGTSMFQALLGYLCIQGPSSSVYVALVLSAAFQSLTWPAAIKLMSEAYAANRSLAFGLWVTNTAIGNIMGSLLASYSLHNEGEREGVLGVFVVPATLCLVAAIVVLGVLKDKRSYEPLVRGVADGENPDRDISTSVSGEMRSIPYSECFQLPGVAAFSAAYGLLKGVAYAMFFWLPFYFVKVRNFDAVASDAFSGLFDVGQVLGAPICGFIAHKTGRLFLVCALAGFLAAFPLLAVALTDGSAAVGAALVAAGLLLGGAVGLIGSEVCVVLCPAATSTVLGIIDGFGSLGASLTQSVIPLLAGRLGWTALFPECAVMACLGAAVLWRPVAKESQSMIRR